MFICSYLFVFLTTTYVFVFLCVFHCFLFMYFEVLKFSILYFLFLMNCYFLWLFYFLFVKYKIE